MTATIANRPPSANDDEAPVTVGWRRDGGLITVLGSGPIDAQAAHHLRDVLELVVEQGGEEGAEAVEQRTDVVVDLSAATRIPSAVTRALDEAGRRLRLRGRRLRVVWRSSSEPRDGTGR